MRNLTISCLAFFVVLAGVLAISPSSVSAAAACTHYASPSGGGNGTNQSSPFRISNLWGAAGPGKTLCLLPGTYTGDANMISPPSGLSGTASNRITVRALSVAPNDGNALIDGQNARTPVSLNRNDYFTIEGINARNSSGHVYGVSESRGVHLRRVVGWNADMNGNAKVFQLDDTRDALIEDCAGFGSARKVLEVYGGSPNSAAPEIFNNVSNATIRRCWLRWEGNNIIGPKVTLSLNYQSSGNTSENNIGTWSGQLMSGGVDQPYAIFGADRLDQGGPANSRILGSIAYLRSSDNFPGRAPIWNYLGGYEISNSAVFIEGHGSTPTFRIDSGAADRTIRNLTSIGGSGPTIGVATNNVVEGPNRGSVPSIFNGSGGARICKRYVNGTLTNDPLWPWPMNQRIIDATRAAGKTAIDVTATIENMFGAIPAECSGPDAGPSGGGLTFETPAPCHVLDSTTLTHSPYGLAWNWASTAKELLLSAICHTDKTAITIGSGNETGDASQNLTGLAYVYHQAQQFNGSAWAPINLTCAGTNTTKISNAWCKGKATGSVPTTAKWFVGYSCIWNGSAWTCGCTNTSCSSSFWQLQEIRR